MSGAACVIIITNESLKLKAASPMLENCLRQVLANPLVIGRVGQEPEIDELVQLGVKTQWDKDEQKWVQGLLRRVVETDLPDVELPEC